MNVETYKKELFYIEQKNTKAHSIEQVVRKPAEQKLTIVALKYCKGTKDLNKLV